MHEWAERKKMITDNFYFKGILNLNCLIEVND
jgi:hypothetical protein